MRPYRVEKLPFGAILPVALSDHHGVCAHIPAVDDILVESGAVVDHVVDLMNGVHWAKECRVGACCLKKGSEPVGSDIRDL